MTVCGDIHGQFYDLIELFKICGEPPVAPVYSQYTNFLFLGDYVDRGYNSIECFSLIIALKVRYKDRMTVLRGNHETSDANRLYGFFDECHKKYGNDRVWRLFTEVFNFLPLAALVENQIFCVHGGLSPKIQKIDDLQAIDRAHSDPTTSPIEDLLTSEVDEKFPGYSLLKPRGYGFGQDITETFLNQNGLKMISRAHQLVMDVTFSSPRATRDTIIKRSSRCSLPLTTATNAETKQPSWRSTMLSI